MRRMFWGNKHNWFFFVYAVVKSYQYTSLTSVMLLDCWSIPCVIVLTWIFLKTKYGFRKFFGVGVCVAGLILVVFSDVHASDRVSKDILLINLYYSSIYLFPQVFSRILIRKLQNCWTCYIKIQNHNIYFCNFLQKDPNLWRVIYL